MSPYLKNDDLILIEDVEIDNLRIGDVVVAVHPLRRNQIVKGIKALSATTATLWSPAGSDSATFGDIELVTVIGRATINLSQLKTVNVKSALP